MFSIGGKWKGKVRVEHADRRLITVLQLFSALQIFNADSRRHMRRLWKDVGRGKIKPALDAQEADLYKIRAASAERVALLSALRSQPARNCCVAGRRCCC